MEIKNHGSIYSSLLLQVTANHSKHYNKVNNHIEEKEKFAAVISASDSYFCSVAAYKWHQLGYLQNYRIVLPRKRKQCNSIE